MDVAVLLANPAASQFTGGLHRTAVRELSRRFQVEAAWPADPSHTARLAEEAASEGAALVVAMGGDGVVHHAAQGVAGSDTTLGIVPVGTTNVVSRLLGIPKRPASAVRMLASGFDVIEHPLLAIEAETTAGSLRRHAVFALGVGTDAVVVEKAEAEPFRKYRFGGLHYARTAVGTVWSDLRRRRPLASVEADGRRRERVLGFMVQFLPAYTYFGRLRLRVAAAAPDPMTVLVVERLPMRRAPAVAVAALGRRGFDRVKGFSVWEGVDRVALTSPAPIPAQADGEILGEVTRLSAEYRPGRLRVAVPDHR